MTFWIVAIALCLCVTALMVLALRRPDADAAGEASLADIQIYRDQLRELDLDLARGVLSESEADSARVEISRRLLAADNMVSRKADTQSASSGLTRVATALIGAFIIGASASLYALLGAPGYPDLPLKQRIQAAEEARAIRPSQTEAEAEVPMREVQASEEFRALVQQLRETVKDRPDDLQGQTLLMQNETRLGNFIAAYTAQARILALKSEDAVAEDWATYAELLIIAAGGYVSPEAEQALIRALSLDPANSLARYYSGLMFLQGGRPDLGFKFWSALLADSTLDDPWTAPIRAQIDDIAQVAGVRYRSPEFPASSGPSVEDISAAQDLTAEERDQMIRSMVNGLAERLATNGGSASEWARLITALGVLGEIDRATSILAEARDVFANEETALAIIEDAAVNAGLSE